MHVRRSRFSAKGCVPWFEVDCAALCVNVPVAVDVVMGERSVGDGRGGGGHAANGCLG